MEEVGVIGLMSGTSLDGVDLVYVKFTGATTFEINNTATIPYPAVWLEQLKNCVELPRDSEKLLQLDKDLGMYYSKLILDFIESNAIQQVDFIASHGHTVHHQPEIGYTLQIGCGKEIFKKTQIKTIYDFRSQDVFLGGQGAPLVPVGDQLLFSEYDYCLNIGGFSNVSYQENGVRKAFDICPVNTVLNFYANQLGLDYDDKGTIARTGVISEQLLLELNGLTFYQSSEPKSLGVEFLKEQMFPVLSKYQLSVKDVLRTLVEHMAIQITKKIRKGNVLVTGGGVYHAFLIERVQFHALELEIIIPNKQLIDYKEALIFAFLGKLKSEGSINCLASVTGASKNHASGVVVTTNESA
ncbi:anhydro-N-acetylmuramic acid kinase [Wenyingzhuangia sp. 2_MG-2023]|nr:anhydro-N-acetylmuramic acid kinase [Wenyingzhuangia sp. 2_MG-2023]MDO6739293.1 anhydro-N-acetylmuramic acid kinase [Wenyingzhuangia sp. 2_MG-2023]